MKIQNDLESIKEENGNILREAVLKNDVAQQLMDQGISGG